MTHQIVASADLPADRRRGGEIRVVLGPKTAGSTSGFMGTAAIAPGERIAEHLHPYSEEFLYRHRRRDRRRARRRVPHPVGAGEGLLIPPHVRHRLVNAGSEDATLVFHLGPLAPRPELGHIDTETDGGPGAVSGA